MSETESIEAEAAELAADLAASDRVVVSRPDANRTLKDELDVATVSHGAVREAFESEGWSYHKHLYFRPDALAERGAELAAELRSEGRLLATHSELLARIVDPETEIDDVAGWREGEFVEALSDAFEAAGWRVDTVGAGSRKQRFYLFPLFAALTEHHPQGRYPLSESELLAYYLGESVEAAVSE